MDLKTALILISRKDTTKQVIKITTQENRNIQLQYEGQCGKNQIRLITMIERQQHTRHTEQCSAVLLNKAR